MQGKTFNLTFEGSVLSEHEPGQVKTDLARLFHIEDPGVIEELFCGETVILRENLDRKSAAEYFRKINIIGGKAALIDSSERLVSAAAVPLKLSREEGQGARIVREAPRDYGIHVDLDQPLAGESDQQWPVSATRIKHAEMTQLPHSQAPPFEAPVPANTAPSSYQRELGRLQVLEVQTKEKCQFESAKLQRRVGQFNRIAAEELEKIKDMGSAAHNNAQQELSELKVLERETRQAGEAKIAAFGEQEEKSREQAQAETARLNALKEEKSHVDTGAMERLEHSREEIGLKAEKEIKRLKLLIENTRHQAEGDIAALERQFSEVESKKLQEVAHLQQQQDETLRELDKELEELQRSQETCKQGIEKDTEDLQQQRRDIQRRKEEELSRLRAMELDMTTKREQGVANTHRAEAQLQRQTGEALQKLRALTRDAEQRHSEALGNSGNGGSTQEVSQGYS